MKFDGKNLQEVLEAHERWMACPENDDDRADFSGAELYGACFPHAQLYGANFRNANLRSADLSFADLTRADMTGANLFDAAMHKTSLRGAIGVGFLPGRIPDTGAFIAWKRVKLRAEGTHYDHSAIAKLRIPEDAQRVCLLCGECRASKAEVLEIQTLDGQPLPDAEAISIRDATTRYKAGSVVSVVGFDTDVSVSHVPGIYFYMDRPSAVRYMTFGDDTDGNPVPINLEEFTEKFADKGLSGTPPQVWDHLVDDAVSKLCFAIRHLPEEEAAREFLDFWEHYSPELLARVLHLTMDEAYDMKAFFEQKARASGADPGATS